MKRFLLHLVFWLCYFAQFAYMSVLWDRSTFPDWPWAMVLERSLIASVLFMIPQMLFPYYMIYAGIENILKKKRTLTINIIEIIFVLFICVVIDRLLSAKIALPYIYHAPKYITPIFDIKRIFMSLMYLGFAFGTMYAVKSVRDQLSAKEREKNLIKEKLETELKFLKNQTNPHFLLNTLNNIYALARKKSDRTAEVVMRLSELLRFMLYESNTKLIKLAAEIKILEDYLELETIRYNQRLAVSFEKNIDDDKNSITPFLLIPFLENAFKHGISETRFESFINIVISVYDHVLHFEIENSKDINEHEKNTANIGLINVKRQLELTYSDYKLNVYENTSSFKVNLRVNLNSYVEI
ncbi:MAG: histidine kinase [Bacteroidetes bacterium]|nr:histidine kinase [Bacteroidota bacterium]